MQNRIYGIDIDLTEPLPDEACVYTDDATAIKPVSLRGTKFDYGEWESIIKNFIQPVPCVFENGRLAMYLNSDDYTKDIMGNTVSYGETGNVMIQFPKRYYKIERKGNILSFKISNYKPDDTYCADAFLNCIGAESEYMYIGAYLGKVINGVLRSISNTSPCTRVFKDLYTSSDIRKKANANGRGFESISYSQYIYLYLISVLFGKSLDVSKTYGNGKSNTEKTIDLSGFGNTKGLFYGSNLDFNSNVKCFGIENLWGTKAQFVDGILFKQNEISFKKNAPFNDYSKYNIIEAYTDDIVDSNGNVSDVTLKDGIIIPFKVIDDPTYSSHFCANFRAISKDTSYVLTIGGGYMSIPASNGLFHMNFSTTMADGYIIGSRLSYC